MDHTGDSVIVEFVDCEKTMLKTLALQLLILAVFCGSSRVSADETIVSKPSAHTDKKVVTVRTGTTSEHLHSGEKKRVEDSELFDPRLGQKYDVRIEQQFTFVNRSKYQTIAIESRRGTLLLVPPDANRKGPAIIGGVGDDVSYELHKLLDGRSAPWLKLEVTELPSQNRITAEHMKG